MISKKKVTALALAGLFVTPVLAATEVDYNEIRSGDGYLTADDNLFSEALENSLNRTDSSKNAVKLSMYGKYDDTSNDGLTELKLSGQAYDNVNYILFADNSGQDNAIHRSSFSLDETDSDVVERRHLQKCLQLHRAERGWQLRRKQTQAT